jgi:alkylation response protein AidB-like acyl-CoA dehydrogenase
MIFPFIFYQSQFSLPVNGSKAFISGSGVSSLYLVMMRLSDGPPGPKGIFSLLMTPDMPGMLA